MNQKVDPIIFAKRHNRLEDYSKTYQDSIMAAISGIAGGYYYNIKQQKTLDSGELTCTYDMLYV